MGGFGSGWHGKGRGKKAVDECLRLDVQYFKHLGALQSGYTAYVTLNWLQGDRNPSGLVRSHVWCNISNAPPQAYFTHEFGGGSYHQEIFLTPSETEFEGHRWWWVCPEDGCGRRVRYLYLPAGENVFRCRGCWDLTFQSCRDSHRHDRLYMYVANLMGIGFQEAKEVIEADGRRRGII